MYQLLKWISKEYNNPSIYITENGVSDKGGTTDTQRVEFFNSYLDAVHRAIDDGVRVKGYWAWTLIDSHEWSSGFTETFGLYHVDFASPNKTRTAKMSAKVYKKIVATNQIDWDYKPDPDIFIEQQTEFRSFCENAGNNNGISIFFQVAIALVAVQLIKMYR